MSDERDLPPDPTGAPPPPLDPEPPPVGDPPTEDWPKTVYATAGHVVQDLVYSQAELDDALSNGWRLTESSLSEGAQ